METSICSADWNVLVATEQTPDGLSSELTFYDQHSWCLNAFPTIREVIAHLRGEVNALPLIEEVWRRDEVQTNIMLLSCAISDTLDDYLGGARYDFSQAAGVFGPSRVIVRPMNRLVRLATHARTSLVKGLSHWRDEWETAVTRFMVVLAAGAEPAVDEANSWSRALLSLLERRFPAKFLSSRPRIPAAFRSQDLTHFDVFKMGQKLVEACPDRDRPILVVGVRTAGSYFAPLLRGYLEAQHYKEVASVTLRPKRGVGPRERECLRRAAMRGSLAIVIDEPVYSASTVAKGLDHLKEAGFPAAEIVALFPTHPNRRDWRGGAGSLALAEVRVFTLEPEEWHKKSLLEAEVVADRLREYFEIEGNVSVRVKASAAADRLTAELTDCQEPGLHWRLKRIYEIELRRGDGSIETRMILAKSAGWGWLGYHAFLAGKRLSGFVPPILGLRDGILYMEWLAAKPRTGEQPNHERLVDSAASYIAGRVRTLGLAEDPTRDLIQAGRHRGTDELAGILSRAYGWKIAAALKRPRIQHQLVNLSSNFPTFIDGKMRTLEWIDGSGGFLKTDFEHHGMGKHELNLTDPAYDLAELILHWSLSEDEEGELIRRYVDRSGDADVPGRLFLYKLLAGTWTMARAVDNLKQPSVLKRHEEFNQRFLEALTFLTIHTTRFCAALSCRPERLRWSEPLVVLDVDGVLDKQTFGFPSTTAAGVEAVSLLASHGMAVALDTARSVSELKEYCRAYGFVGGIAEYGSFAWDAVSGKELVLVSSESLAQMQELRNSLRTIPGVFLNDGCRFTVRAHVYSHGTTVALPEALVRNIMASLHLNRLRLHQTYTDSTVMAAETDKGSGLIALLSLAGYPNMETVAVGDSEPDLPMFRAATRCYAPAQIGCPQAARLLGCRIALRPYQSGLLEIVRSLIHPQGGRCSRCHLPQIALRQPEELFLRLLHTADQSPAWLLLRSLLDPRALHAFRQ